jgi:hypothetical protein
LAARSRSWAAFSTPWRAAACSWTARGCWCWRPRTRWTVWAAAALRCLDAAIQAHGGGGVCQDFPLAQLFAAARTLRIADGPDEVHLTSLGKLELRRARL